MQFTVLENLQDLYTLKSSWDPLETQDKNVTPFQTWGWNYYWWKYLSGTKKLHTLVFFDNSKVVGIIPLWVRQCNETSILEFIGTRGSDYLDILCLDSHRSEIISLFLTHFISSDFDFINFEDIRESSKTIHSLRYRAQKLGLSFKKKLHSPCYKIQLPQTYNDFLQNLSKKLRKNILYYTRYLNKRFSVQYDSVDSSHIKTLISLHQLRQKEKGNDGTYNDPSSEIFIKEVAKYFYKRNTLHLSMLAVNHDVIASALSFISGDTLYNYSPGFHPNYKRFHPGTILRSLNIQMATVRGLRYYDLMRDYENYKIEWGGQERMNVKIQIARNSATSEKFERIQREHLKLLPYSPSSI